MPRDIEALRQERSLAHEQQPVRRYVSRVRVGCEQTRDTGRRERGEIDSPHVLVGRLAAGLGDRARAFHIVPISQMFLFAVLVCAAIATVTRPEIHRRLMLLATISIMPPAIARISFLFNAGFAPGARPGLGPLRTVESVAALGYVTDALILAPIAHDLLRRGRPHPANVIGGILIVSVQVLRGPASTTQGWYAIADFLARFSG